MKGYTDLDQYNPTDVKILQNADIPVSHRRNTTVIQNVNIQSGTGFDSVIQMIQLYGGVQNFVKALYSHAIQKSGGNLNQAAEMLRIPRQTLSEYRKKYLLSD